MRGLRHFRSALVAGASLVTLASAADAKVYDIPGGDLSATLDTYIKQSGVQIVYLNDKVRGHHSEGVRGDYTEIAALTQVLRGTGFTTEAIPPNVIGIVPQPENVPTPVRVAQASRPAAPPPAQSAIETVVVTAQHKSEDIQTVPIAVTALSQQQLTERQIAGGPDLVKEVPNLTFSKTNFTGYNLEIRGIGTQAISVTTDPAVAVAFNDTPFIRNHFFEQEFYDLDNVEVLRGPQGTLYGRNATAGVVNVLSAKPTDQYEAMLSADIGNYGNRRLEGMVNIPIVGDTLDLRIAGEWTKRDGYTEDTTLNTSVDGRDLWSGRVTLGWKPTSNVQTYLVWEHFSEDDDRLRSGKQLCRTDPGPSEVDGFAVSIGDTKFLSQGCLPTSLYSASAFEVPNGWALPYYGGLSETGIAIREDFDPYASTTQSRNLHDIESTILPTYRAKNDTLEFNADWKLSPELTLTSQTGYNHDFLWSTEDYNRFDTAPGAFVECAGCVDGQEKLVIPDPEAGTNGIPADSAVFCDPQLGCSDRLVAEDLSTEHAWQLSHEFRLASNFSGPLNFSVGANYLHYETEENYYVFVNTLTMFAQSNFVEPNGLYVPGSNVTSCLLGGERNPNPSVPQNAIFGCPYTDPNPISSLNNEGHNYFLSQNPYLLNSYATFGELYYDVTKNLKLTEGVRWTDDQKHFIDIPSEVVVPGYGYAVTGIINQQLDQWTGRSAVNWTPTLDFTDQTLVYGSYSHGYKAGGANPPGALFPTFGTDATVQVIHPLTFKPEFIDAFELGTKNTLLDGALTLNGDMFFYDYKNYQISEIVDRTAINNNFNATVKGAELEANWEPAPGLKFSFAGGYENGVLDNGDRSVDLMDRTAGATGWIVVKPFVAEASNCILPGYVIAEELKFANYSIGSLCDEAYTAHLDPITELPYTPNPTVAADGASITGYPGFDPLSVDPKAPANVNGGLGLPPNNGGGFNKNLSGNQLPNAPHFTTSFTAEYSMPVSEDWVATLHGDFYWQSQQWARVFNDNPYDKLHGYSNVNLSLILNSANGWQVMGYVKNVFNVTAITGDFLNSDDSGLTTNVFLTDPRLYGIRVTKHLDQGDGFWGSDYTGNDFFTGLFSDTDNGRPPLWIELGGGLEGLGNAQDTFSPPFMAGVTQPNLVKVLGAQSPPRYGLDEEAKVSWQPDDDGWIVSAAIRYGRSNADREKHQQTANADVPVHSKIPFPPPIPTVFPSVGPYAVKTGYSFYPNGHVRLANAQTQQSESHLILDFMAGKDIGLGMFGGSSVVSGGVRIAQFSSKTTVNLHAEPDVQYPAAPINTFSELRAFKYDDPVQFHDYAAMLSAQRSFRGIGPSVAWSNSLPFAGDSDRAEISFDWGVNAASLFGRQKVRGHHQTTTRAYTGTHFNRLGEVTHAGVKDGKFVNFASYGIAHYSKQSVGISRDRSVMVPNLGGFVGLSMRYNNAKVSFGYRADEFFGAMDGGIDSYKAENRGFFGPYANISIGLGG